MELTPMMQQYVETKKQHPDAILFFRLGDFYEMFFDDAKLVSGELGLTLTSRSSNKEKSPMCGVPYHAAESYIMKLIHKGYKVAIAEQIGDPKAKGLTKRQVVKIVTPGTVLSESSLHDEKNNYIALIAEETSLLTLAAADVSTGECFYAVYEGKQARQMLFDELYRLLMPELILMGTLSFGESLEEFLALRMPNCTLTRRTELSAAGKLRLTQHFDKNSLPKQELAQKAVAVLLDYLHETVKTDLSHINRLVYLDASKNLVLDTYTLRNLEIIRNLRDGGKKDTLLDVLDFTKTAMGSRLLRKWLEYPLLSCEKIEHRLDGVAEFAADFSLREDVQKHSKEIFDFERLLTRIEVGTANARDLVALKLSLGALPPLKARLFKVSSALLGDLERGIELFEDIVTLLERAIVEEPGISLREGGIIKNGYNEELDEYRHIAQDSKKMLQQMEEREKELTGIKVLKIGYNKVFGYYIEVRHSGIDLVPDRYIRKQTLANVERYITEELKDFETKILGAQEKIVQIEYRIFTEIRETIQKALGRIQQTAQHIAVLDVLAALAEAANRYNYVRPKLSSNKEIFIRDGRHPLVERILAHDLFVPNDTELNHRDCEIMLLTGPNMAGKSTYMRQVALLTLMAQTGSFVPAREMTLSPVDRIFTRIGASDDLVSGQSTFMVEMNEVAQILKYATKDSLIILDEIGRGTSTFDGMSIARAVVEYIRNKIHAKTLFATHYHELTDMEDERIKNFCIAVKERGTKIAFLRRIIKGSADKSYGVHVARLAGLPKSVTERAQLILDDIERNALDSTMQKAPRDKESPQKNAAISSLFAAPLHDAILSLDVMAMTPLEALNELYRLHQQVKGEEGKR